MSAIQTVPDYWGKSGEAQFRVPMVGGLGTCCQYVFQRLRDGRVSVAWLDETQWVHYPGAVGCPYRRNYM